MKKDFKLDYVNYTKEILIFNDSYCFETPWYIDNAEELCKKYFEFENDGEKKFFYIVKNEKELKEKFLSFALDEPNMDYIKEINYRIIAINKDNSFSEIYDFEKYDSDLFDLGDILLTIKKVKGKILFIKRKAKY
jgi:hypothetical protein